MKEYNFAFILPNILFLYYKHITLTISDRNAFWQTVHPPSFSLWSIRKAISFSFDITLISQVYDICDGIVSISHVYDICDGFTTRGRAQAAQACELRRVLLCCSIFLNTLNTAYLIVKICDKMYYFFNKNYLPNRQFVFLIC